LASGVASLLALTIAILPMGITFVRQRDLHTDSYALGAAFGTGFLIFLGAAALRAVYGRLSSGDAPLQACVAIAAVAAIGVQYVIRANDHDRGVAQVLSMIEDCQQSDPTPFGPPPPGTSLVAISPEARAQFEHEATTALPEQISPETIVTQELVDGGGTTRGVVLGIPGLASDPQAEAAFESGVFASMGTTPAEQEVSGVRMAVADGPGFQVAAGANGCWSVLVLAEPNTATQTAAPLLSGQ
jgi:hypothetical protein